MRQLAYAPICRPTDGLTQRDVARFGSRPRGRKSDVRVIEAAGGLVWRRSVGGVEVVLVHRPLRDDWTLPIGRREPGESLEECALREVAEETGYACRLIRFVETLTVEAEDGLHRFHIYEMEPISGEFMPNPETDQAPWFRISDAIDRATYPNVQTLLLAASSRLH